MAQNFVRNSNSNEIRFVEKMRQRFYSATSLLLTRFQTWQQLSLKLDPFVTDNNFSLHKTVQLFLIVNLMINFSYLMAQKSTFLPWIEWRRWLEKQIWVEEFFRSREVIPGLTIVTKHFVGDSLRAGVSNKRPANVSKNDKGIKFDQIWLILRAFLVDYGSRSISSQECGLLINLGFRPPT